MNANRPVPAHNAPKTPSSRPGNAGGSPTADGHSAGQPVDFKNQLDQSQTARRADATTDHKKDTQQTRHEAAGRPNRETRPPAADRADTGAPTSSEHGADNSSADQDRNDTANASRLIRRWRLPTAEASVASGKAGIPGRIIADGLSSSGHRAVAATVGPSTDKTGAASASENGPKSDAARGRTDDKTRLAARALVAPGLSVQLPMAPPSAAGQAPANRGSGKPAALTGHGGRGDGASAGGKDMPNRGLTPLLAGADGDTAAGQSADKNMAQSLAKQTLSPQQIDALARLVGRSNQAGLNHAGGSGPAASTPVSPDALSPNVAAQVNVQGSAQAGPNAAIAGGAAGPAPGAAGSSLGASLAAPLGSDGWNAALGQHTLRLATGGARQAQIQLHPRELGQLNISVTVNGHNQAQLHLASPHAHVREAVESALPQLKQSLAAGGLSLGQASVGDQGSQAAFGNTGSRGQSGRGRGSPQPAPTIEAIGEREPAPVARAISGLRGGIDIFA